jgi:hypothetical protein
VIASLFGAAEPKMLAQHVEQRGARVEGQAMAAAVDRAFDRDGRRGSLRGGRISLEEAG